jgi:hypothetical protein
LPAIYELLSLIDPSVPDAPKLPDGHPSSTCNRPAIIGQRPRTRSSRRLAVACHLTPVRGAWTFLAMRRPLVKRLRSPLSGACVAARLDRQLTDRKARPPVGLCAPDRVA